ncbi:MAG: rod shape-determining protein MreC [Acidimicrobiales bacterium]|nr:rod shape-determining protein MreC [Acidimicrobiales bacterium]
MAVYRRSFRTRNVLAILVLAALTLITIDARSNGHGVLTNIRSKVSDGFSPLQRATHAALAPIGNFLTGAVDYGSLRSENQHLRDQVAGLQAEAIRAASAEQAAQQVLKDAGLPFAGNVPGVTAQVIDNGSSNFDNSVTINKGRASGIAPGQPVLSAGGLVGSVVSASSHAATIRLIVDPSFVAGVALPGGNLGYAQGQGATHALKVTVIAQHTGGTGSSVQLPPPTLKVGDPVITSGLKYENFPAGIPVGQVTRAVVPPGASEPDITMTPLASLNNLDFVQILLWSPQTSSAAG